MLHVAPSLAAGNLLRLEEEIRRLEEAKADAIHVDCMDGHFVPLLTLGVPIVEAVRSITKLPLDVHIMVTNPDAVFMDYIKAGADILTFHQEAAIHAHRIAMAIRQAGKKVGIAINPGTHWQTLEYLLPYIDQVTIMAVNPGFSRQPHIPTMVEKVRSLSAFCKAQGLNVAIQVDGGVNATNTKILQEAGMTHCVAGGAVMGTPNYAQAIEQLKKGL